MKIILCEDVDNLGDMGETVNVAPGYARNFLLPRRLAVQAETASAKQLEHEMRIIGKREEKRRGELAEIAKTIEGIKVEFTAKVGAEGKLFGSVTSLHIATKLQELDHPINRRKIKLAEPIRTVGEHKVPVQLTTGIEATITVVIVAEATEESEPIEAKAEASEAPEAEGAESDEQNAETPEETGDAAPPQDEPESESPQESVSS